MTARYCPVFNEGHTIHSPVPVFGALASLPFAPRLFARNFSRSQLRFDASNNVFLFVSNVNNPPNPRRISPSIVRRGERLPIRVHFDHEKSSWDGSLVFFGVGVAKGCDAFSFPRGVCGTGHGP